MSERIEPIHSGEHLAGVPGGKWSAEFWMNLQASYDLAYALNVV